MADRSDRNDSPSAVPASENGRAAVGDAPFDPLTGDLTDLRRAHGQCWLWQHLTIEFDRLDDVITDAGTFLEPFIGAACPDWARQAASGIARSNVAIHQYAEGFGGYAAAARRLHTTRIPSEPPTLSDDQIYAMLAICEARMAAEAYAEIAAGIEDEMQQSGVGHDDPQDIEALRADVAEWERSLWRYADDLTATAEKFLLFAKFSVTAADPSALKRVESQLATMRRKLSDAAAAAAPYRQGRRRGAVSKLTRALAAVAHEVGSTDSDAVLGYLEDAGDEIFEGVRFQGIEDDKLYYVDPVKNDERSIAIDSLKRRLRRLPDV